jgi:hypothetical protein
VGRSPRILVEGGIYHVYNRVSRGEHAFRDEAEAERLLRRLSETKCRAGFQVKEVAPALEKYVESASRLVSRAATRRIEDEAFGAKVRTVDAAVIDRYGER